VKVVVIGGGLAGITAAIALAQAKHEVTLLEAKPRLGGATMSFTRDGLVIDTGQHVFLRCCTAYRGLLDRLGVTAQAPLQPRFDVTVFAPGKKAALRRRRVPAPLHMLPALLGYPFLNWSQRLRLSRVALAFRRLDPADQQTDEQRLGDWLAAHGQDERTRRVLWDLFSVSSLNVPGDDASLALAAVVVQTGLLGKADAADIGVPALPLGELHGTAAAKLLAELGVEVRLSAKVASIEPEGDQFLVRLSRTAAATEGDSSGNNSGPQRQPVDTYSAPPAPSRGLAPGEGAMGEGVPHDLGGPQGDHSPGGKYSAVVLAVPHEQAAKLMPPGALPAETVDGWAGLGAAPIVNVHVIYDRKVMDVPFAAAVDSPVQWVFDRTRISGMHARGGTGQYLALSQSAADEYANMPVAELREIFLPALEALFPAAKDATVTEFFVTREKRATFRQVPGTAKLRPKAGTDLPGLVLAGSWTDTGWPDTMEGAVRSGLNAVIALAPAPDGKDRHRIGRGSKPYLPGGRPPVPPDVSAGADTSSVAPAATTTERNATVNEIVNSSMESGAIRGTNPENSDLDAGREAVTEAIEEQKQVNDEADEREVRS